MIDPEIKTEAQSQADKYRKVLSSNPNDSEARYQLALLIYLGRVKAEHADFPDGEIPNKRPKQVAKLFRLILKTNKNHSETLYRLGCLILIDAVQAEENDFPDRVIPEGHNRQAAKLFRLILANKSDHLKSLEEIYSLIQKGRINPVTEKEMAFARKSYLERQATLYRLKLLINTHDITARRELAKLILQGHVIAIESDFLDKVVPKSMYEQPAKLYNFNLDIASNDYDSLCELAKLIHFGFMKPTQRAFDKYGVPVGNTYEYLAKTYREILKGDPYHLEALYYLAKLILGGQIKAVESDFPDRVMPGSRFYQAQKLFRIILQCGPTTDLQARVKEKIVDCFLEENSSSMSAFYAVTMALSPELPPEDYGFLSDNSMAMLIGKNPNEFIKCLLADSVLTEQDKRPYFLYLNRYREALTPQNLKIINDKVQESVQDKSANLRKSCRVVTRVYPDYPAGIGFFGRMLDRLDGAHKISRVQRKNVQWQKELELVSTASVGAFKAQG